MRHPLSPAELRLALFCAALCAVALVAPAVPQAAAFHGFADARGWQGIPVPSAVRRAAVGRPCVSGQNPAAGEARAPSAA